MTRFSMGPIFAITEWITKFAYVNILWIIFTLVGFGLFGFFPATISMFTIIRKWIIGDIEVPIFKTFWTTYKKEFIKSNLVWLVIVTVTALVYVNLRFMEANNEGLLKITHIPLYLFIFAVLITTLYIIPVYVHYDVKFFQIFKNAFLTMLINPINNIIMVMGIAITFYILTFIPGLLFFFGGILLAYLIMWPCYQSFQKVAQKKENLQTS